MNHRSRSIVLILTFLVLSLASAAHAQIDPAGTDFTAFYIQPATSGSFAPSGDNYALTLNSVPSITPLIAITPSRDAREELTPLLMDALSMSIAQVPPIVTLRVDGKTHIFLMKGLVYSVEQASVTYELAYLSPAKPDIASTFEEAVFFIYVENRLGALLDTTLIELKNSTRLVSNDIDQEANCFVISSGSDHQAWCPSFGDYPSNFYRLGTFKGTYFQVSMYVYETYGIAP